jgi:hypothetical protein
METSWFKPMWEFNHVLLGFLIKDKLASLRECLVTSSGRHESEESISILNQLIVHSQGIQRFKVMSESNILQNFLKVGYLSLAYLFRIQLIFLIESDAIKLCLILLALIEVIIK